MKRLLRSLLTRLGYTLPVLWLVVSIVFLLIHIVPAIPSRQMLGEARALLISLRCATHTVSICRSTRKYALYWRGVLHGDLGRSIRLNDSVTHLCSRVIPSP